MQQFSVSPEQGLQAFINRIICKNCFVAMTRKKTPFLLHLYRTGVTVRKNTLSSSEWNYFESADFLLIFFTPCHLQKEEIMWFDLNIFQRSCNKSCKIIKEIMYTGCMVLGPLIRPFPMKKQHFVLSFAQRSYLLYKEILSEKWIRVNEGMESSC